MNTNKEIEYKILLDEKTFSNILSAYPDHKSYTQINYYLTSKELQEKKYALRVREKEGRYELTLKIPQGFAKMEYNLDISENIAKEILADHMPKNDITDVLEEHGIDPSLIIHNASLKTIRHDIILDYGVLSLDENFYNQKHDFEMEFELTDEKGHQQFNELKEQFHLDYTKNAPSKIKRVLATM
jgi:uncharacterized protein YjbK